MIPAVRPNALSLAIDRAAGARTLNGSTAAAASFYPAGSPYVTSRPCANAAFDPTRAKQLLAGAGGIPGNTITLTYASGSPDEASMMAMVNDWKANLGIKVALKGLEFPQFVEAIHTGKVPGPMASGWAWDYPSAYNFLSPLYESTAADNVGHYTSPGFDKLMADIRNAPTENAGGPLIEKAAELLCTDMPGTPTATVTQATVFSGRVSGAHRAVNGFLNLASLRVVK